MKRLSFGEFLWLGVIGMVVDSAWHEPNSEDDYEAAERAMQFNVSSIQAPNDAFIMY